MGHTYRSKSAFSDDNREPWQKGRGDQRKQNPDAKKRETRKRRAQEKRGEY